MKFRKKPVVIEAVQWTGTNGVEIAKFCGTHPTNFAFPLNGPAVLTIPTLEGEMRADVGDWIIRGVKGEVYPCKPDIFTATYDPA